MGICRAAATILLEGGLASGIIAILSISVWGNSFFFLAVMGICYVVTTILLEGPTDLHPWEKHRKCIIISKGEWGEFSS